MNSNFENDSSIDRDLQVRLMNLVMGEASDFERDQLQSMMEQRADVAAYYEHVVHLHGLLCEVGTGELPSDVDANGADVVWQLSPDRRKKVLSVLSGNDASPNVVVALTDSASKPVLSSWNWWTVGVVVVTGAVLVGLMLPSRFAARKRVVYGPDITGGTQSAYYLDEDVQYFPPPSVPPSTEPVQGLERVEASKESKESWKLIDGVKNSATENVFRSTEPVQRLRSVESLAESNKPLDSGRTGSAKNQTGEAWYDNKASENGREAIGLSRISGDSGRLTEDQVAKRKSQKSADDFSDGKDTGKGWENQMLTTNDDVLSDRMSRHDAAAAEKVLEMPFEPPRAETSSISELGESVRKQQGGSEGRYGRAPQSQSGGQSNEGYPVPFNDPYEMAVPRAKSELGITDIEAILAEQVELKGRSVPDVKLSTPQPRDPTTLMLTVSPEFEIPTEEEIKLNAETSGTSDLYSTNMEDAIVLKGGHSRPNTNRLPSVDNASIPHITLDAYIAELDAVNAESAEQKLKQVDQQKAEQHVEDFRFRDQNESDGEKYLDWLTLADQTPEQSEAKVNRFFYEPKWTVPGRINVPENSPRYRQSETSSKPARSEAIDETSTSKEPFSTFSLHVSDVSFQLAQTALGQGQWPEPAKVRIEEFVNALDYHDPLPRGKESVACRVEQAIHPFLMQRNLLRVSMRTAASGRSQKTPLRLTLLLDNSGSMERVDRRQAVLQAFRTLMAQLKSTDQVTLIGFAGTPRLLADKIAGDQGESLVKMIETLPSEGGTNIESALLLAYEKATEQRLDGAQNRVILMTDGAVNLGNANPQSLAKQVVQMRDAGIAFDTAGIGAQDLNDEVLEALSRQGDGRYYLLDSADAASDSFSAQIAGAMRPSAQNVKVQVEFNPQRVGRYRLLGFENHRLNKEDFRNDKIDAAEMAAAEAGVALYQFEIKPQGQGDVGSVSVRFQDLATGRMVERRWPIPYEPSAPRLELAPTSMQLATVAALFASKLRGGPIAENIDLSTLRNLLSNMTDSCGQQPRAQQLRTMIDQAMAVSR
jgi:Mg-chelatase subunit ChlD